MSAFVVVALLLTLIAAAAIALPLIRPARGSPPAVVAAVVTCLLLASAAALLYPTWSSWDWNKPAPSADSPSAMVGKLARRLERSPDDLDGWLLLGRSYAQIGQYPMAARAFQRADQLAGGKNAEALMGLAEALVLGERSGLDGRAGRLFEQALALDAKSNRALFYAAIAALERGERPLARERFQHLLENGDPPPEVRRLIEEQIRQLEAPVVEAGVVSIPLHVTLSPEVSAHVAPGATLFVLARVPGQRGPPLAARRLEAHFPQEVELRSSDAMIAGTGFEAGQELEIEARVANAGGAVAVSGDPFGTARVVAGGKERVGIEIGKLKP